MMYNEKRGKKDEQVNVQLTQPQIDAWNAAKGKLVSDKRPCLRILVQMPAKPTKSAVDGMVAPEATGPKAKNQGKKRDWLVVVDDMNSEDLFSQKSNDLRKLLKRVKPVKRAKR
jgi:hypothetical protein